MDDPPVTLEELRSVDLFDGLADPELAEWAAVARPYHLGPGEIIHEQGDDPKGLQLLLEGEAQALIRRERSHRAGEPSPRADMDGRDRRAHGQCDACDACRPRPTPVWRSSRLMSFAAWHLRSRWSTSG